MAFSGYWCRSFLRSGRRRRLGLALTCSSVESHSGQFGRVWAGGGLVAHRGGRCSAPACTLSATTKQTDVFNQPANMLTQNVTNTQLKLDLPAVLQP